MKFKLLIIATYLFSNLTWAQQLNLQTISEFKVNSIPTFFFKVSPDGKYLAYTLASNSSQPGAGGVNILHNTLNNRETRIPGPWDPVFNHQSDYMTIPRRIHGNTVNYDFYLISELEQRGLSARSLFTDTQFDGLYQSVGLISQHNNQYIFRVISEGNQNHKMRDYQFGHNQITPIGPIKYLCPGLSLKLPMLSKNGQEIGALDTKSGKTTIYRIQSNGQCTKLFDLGDKFGKVNFSYDNRYLTFHKYNTNNPQITEGFIAIPDSRTTSDIYLHDRVKKKLHRLTNNYNSNALYPEFLADGKIVYLNHPHDRRHKVSFVTIKTQIFEVNNDNDFFKYLPEYTRNNLEKEYISSYLISNNLIKINNLKQYNRYIDLVINNNLLWPFIQKMAKDNFSLEVSKILTTAMKNSDKQLTSYLLAEDTFFDYQKVIQALLNQIINNTLKLNDDIKDMFLKFVARNNLFKLNQSSFDFFLEYFSHDHELITDLIENADESNLQIEIKKIFDLYLNAATPSDLFHLIISLTHIDNYAITAEKFINSTNFELLNSRQQASMVRTITRRSIPVHFSLMRVRSILSNPHLDEYSVSYFFELFKAYNANTDEILEFAQLVKHYTNLERYHLIINYVKNDSTKLIRFIELTFGTIKVQYNSNDYFNLISDHLSNSNCFNLVPIELLNELLDAIKSNIQFSSLFLNLPHSTQLTLAHHLDRLLSSINTDTAHVIGLKQQLQPDLLEALNELIEKRIDSLSNSFINSYLRFPLDQSLNYFNQFERVILWSKRSPGHKDLIFKQSVKHGLEITDQWLNLLSNHELNDYFSYRLNVGLSTIEINNLQENFDQIITNINELYPLRIAMLIQKISFKTNSNQLKLLKKSNIQKKNKALYQELRRFIKSNRKH
jgi:hypothetical protein